MADNPLQKKANSLLLLHEKFDEVGADLNQFAGDVETIESIIESEGAEIQGFVQQEFAPLVQKVIGNPNLSQENKKREFARLVKDEEELKDHLDQVESNLSKFKNELERIIEDINETYKYCEKGKGLVEELEEMETS